MPRSSRTGVITRATFFEVPASRGTVHSPEALVSLAIVYICFDHTCLRFLHSVPPIWRRRSWFMSQVAALCGQDRLARLRMRKGRGQHRAANATPVEDEMNWAVPQPRAGHTANVSHNLLETTNFIWHPNLKSRSFHIVSKFLRITKARVTLISLCSF